MMQKGGENRYGQSDVLEWERGLRSRSLSGRFDFSKSKNSSSKVMKDTE